MEIKVKSYSTQSSLISSIIFIIIGGVLITYADSVKTFISIGIGTLLATISVISLVIYFLSRRKEDSIPNKKALILGVVLLVLAIIFIFFSGIVEQFIKFIVGGWILFSGIIRLINTLSMNYKNTKFIPLLIVAILLIIVGIYTIIGNLFGDILRAVGFIMIIYSIIEIVGYIFYTKDKQEKDQEGATSLIIKDKEKEEKTEVTKKSKKKVKDVEEDNNEKEDVK